jgi:hypothetical protein
MALNCMTIEIVRNMIKDKQYKFCMNEKKTNRVSEVDLRPSYEFKIR